MLVIYNNLDNLLTSLIDFPVVTCRHDLDNIVLEKLGDIRTMHAVYELEALVLTGEQQFFHDLLSLYVYLQFIYLSLQEHEFPLTCYFC